MAAPWEQDYQQDVGATQTAAPWEQDYGTPPAPDTSAMRDHVESNMKAQLQAENEKTAEASPGLDSQSGKIAPPPPKPAQTLKDALEAGWQSSFSGLFVDGKMPDTVLPEDAPRALKIASQISSLVGDLPAMAAGIVAGGAAGSEVPVIGNIAGAAMGAFAVPAAMRKILIDHYQKGDIKDAGDFADRVVSTAWEAAKGMATGYATAAAGGVGAAVAGGAGKYLAEVAAMTTASKALEGHLPNWDDFVNAGIVLGGFHAASGGVDLATNKIADIYKSSGIRPEDVVNEAQTNPTLKAQILSDNIPGEKIQVPTPDEQAAKGLKPLTEQDLANEPGREEPQQEKSTPLAERTDLSDAEKKVLSRIGESENPDKPLLDVQQVYNDRFDFLHNLKKAVDETGEQLSPSEDPYKLGRLFAGVGDKVRAFVDKGSLDFDTQKTNGEGLQQIINDAKEAGGGTTERFEAYAMAKRAIELDGRGIKAGIDINAAKQVVADAPKEFEDLNQRRIDFKNRVLDYAKGAGLFSDEQVQAMKELNQEHIAFRRVQEVDQNGKVPGNGKGLKRIKGSDLQIQSPLAQDFKDTDMLIRMADTNRINLAAADALAGDEGSVLTKVKTPMKAVDVGADEIVKGLSQQGIDLSDEGVEGIKIFRPKNQPLADNQIAVFRDGKREVYEGDQGVVDSLRHFEGNEVGTGIFTKLMQGVTKAVRTGYTADPGFGLRHTWRAQFYSALTSKTGLVPFYHPALAIADMVKGSPVAEQWLIDGGAQKTFDMMDDKYFQNRITQAEQEVPMIKKGWNAVTKPLDWVHAFVMLGDNATKLAEYKRSPGIMNPDGTLNESATPDQRAQAAMNSREVTPDYSRVGAKMQVAKSIAFLNAGLQGSDLAVRNFKENPLGSTAKALAFYTVPALATWWATHDQDWYKALPDWEKDLYLNFHKYSWEQTDSATFNNFAGDKKIEDGKMLIDKDGLTIRLPQTFDVGLIFGSLPMRMLDAIHDKDPTAARDILKSIGEKLPSMPVPDALKEPAEQFFNKDVFSGRAIVSDQKLKLLPDLQYDQYTSQTARVLGKLIQAVPGMGMSAEASPMRIDHLIRSWGGPTGQYAISVLDKAIVASGMLPDPVKPVSSWADSPFFREFVARYPDAKDKRIQDFLDREADADTVQNSFKFMVKQGDIQGAMSLRSQYSDISQQLPGIKEFINTQNSLAQKVMQDKTTDPTQKRQLIDGLIWNMISAAKRGNQMLDDLERQPKEK